MYMTGSQSLDAVKGTPTPAWQELLAHLPEACEDPSLEKGSPLRSLLKAEHNRFAHGCCTGNMNLYFVILLPDLI